MKDIKKLTDTERRKESINFHYFCLISDETYKVLQKIISQKYETGLSLLLEEVDHLLNFSMDMIKTFFPMYIKMHEKDNNILLNVKQYRMVDHLLNFSIDTIKTYFPMCIKMREKDDNILYSKDMTVDHLLNFSIDTIKTYFPTYIKMREKDDSTLYILDELIETVNTFKQDIQSTRELNKAKQIFMNIAKDMRTLGMLNEDKSNEEVANAIKQSMVERLQ